jgi:hypothetical protein
MAENEALPEMVPMEEYLQHVWAAIKDRGRYLALIVKELDDRGLDTDDIIGTALYRYGSELGKKAGKIEGVDELIRLQLSSRAGGWPFKVERPEVTPERAVIINNYCPLVAVWQEMGLSKQEVIRMCELFEKREEGRVAAVGLKVEAPETFAKGDPICRLVFTKA